MSMFDELAEQLKARGIDIVPEYLDGGAWNLTIRDEVTGRGFNLEILSTASAALKRVAGSIKNTVDNIRQDARLEPFKTRSQTMQPGFV